MPDLDEIDHTINHLMSVRSTLLRENQTPLARCIEGVLAELTDTSYDAAHKWHRATQAWTSLFANARGLADFGIWRDDETQRLSLNRDFQQHINAIHAVFAKK